MVAVFWVLCLWVALGQASDIGVGRVATRAHATNDVENVRAIRRALQEAEGKTYTLNRTSIEKGWQDATLFEFGTSGSSESNSSSLDSTLEYNAGIAVICKTCYVNGSVHGALSINGGFNMSQVIDDVEEEVVNVTRSALSELKDYAEEVTKNFFTFDSDEIPSFPTLDVDLDLDDIDGLPDVSAHFQFDDLELYLELDVQLSVGATYTLNLFTSQSPVGIEIPGLTAGAVFSVKLILVAEAEIDISSGIHIKLDDGLALDLELFNKEMSGVTLPGGRMEVLPVTVQGQGKLQALLQLEASVGFEIDSGPLGVIDDLINFSAGIGAEAFAYVADFQVNVNGSSSLDSECAIEAVAEYTLGVAAAAGATVAIDTYQWGPAPSTSIPVWYTTLASICAGTRTLSTPSATVTPPPTLEKRDDLITTTLTTTSAYTIVNCVKPGLVDCPVRFQNTTSATREMTTVLTVKDGVEPTFPASTYASVTSAIPFGEGVKSIGAASGSPTSYVPPPPPSSPATPTPTVNAGDMADEGEAGHGNNNKLIIGLSVGLGVPALAALIAGVVTILKRKGTASEDGDSSGERKQPRVGMTAVDSRE